MVICRLSLGRCLLFVETPVSLVLEFVAKTEFISNPLPRSFLVASLSDFAAGLDDELLLCPPYLSGQDFLFFSSSLPSFSVP